PGYGQAAWPGESIRHTTAPRCCAPNWPSAPRSLPVDAALPLRGNAALTFAGNIFVGPHIMSGWLRAFVEVNPVIHRTTAVCGLTSGTGAAGAAGWVLACAVLTAVFAPLTMRLYRPGRVGRCADLQLRAVVGGAVGQVGAVPGDDLPDPQRGQRAEQV